MFFGNICLHTVRICCTKEFPSHESLVGITTCETNRPWLSQSGDWYPRDPEWSRIYSNQSLSWIHLYPKCFKAKQNTQAILFTRSNAWHDIPVLRCWSHVRGIYSSQCSRRRAQTLDCCGGNGSCAGLCCMSNTKKTDWCNSHVLILCSSITLSIGTYSWAIILKYWYLFIYSQAFSRHCCRCIDSLNSFSFRYLIFDTKSIGLQPEVALGQTFQDTYYVLNQYKGQPRIHWFWWVVRQDVLL